jgi:hypothetical protein
MRRNMSMIPIMKSFDENVDCVLVFLMMDTAIQNRRK